MRLIPRRKRTWVLVLFGVAIIGAAAFWFAATEKSEFERRFDRVKVGMTISEALGAVAWDRTTLTGLDPEVGPSSHLRFTIVDDGEHIVLDFEHDRLVKKEFRPLPVSERMREQWRRVFRSAPPF